MPEILRTHTPALFEAAVLRAAEAIRRGTPVALPTETVYGLAANALDPEAVRRIYVAKNRPSENPLIVHVAGLPMAQACSREWPSLAGRLAGAFWPGPLTLVVPRASEIPDLTTAGGDTVGLRWPSHPFIQAVINACGFPLAAPSANPANAISPTTARHVAESLGDRVALIVDGGACQVGIESTVVEVSDRGWRILRPGMIHEEALQDVTGQAACRETCPPPANRPVASPGLQPRHYAPRARLITLRWSDDASLVGAMEAQGLDPATTHVLAYHSVPSPHTASRICVIPDDPEAYARAMYAEWHRSDTLGARAILLEAPPDHPAWSGIRDRIRRATTPAA